MNILYTEQILEKYSLVGLTIVLILACIFFVIGFYLMSRDKPYICISVIAVTFILSTAGSWFCFRDVYKGNNRYYVTVDNIDKLNSYEIVEQKGDLYIIQDKEDSNEKIHK